MCPTGRITDKKVINQAYSLNNTNKGYPQTKTRLNVVMKGTK